jgi:cell division protein FtsQ
VLVTGGNFVEPLRIDSINSQTEALVKLANFLDSEKKYHSLIDQAYIERDGNIMMVPKLGDQIIELGTADELDEKFSNLLTFYRRGMPRAGWNTYSKVSLKYRGQVVCTKETR